VTRIQKTMVGLSLLRVGVQMLMVALRAKPGQPAYWRHQAQARAAWPQPGNAGGAPLLARLREGIASSQRENASTLS
jgi:hypothetical protein